MVEHSGLDSREYVLASNPTQGSYFSLKKGCPECYGLLAFALPIYNMYNFVDVTCTVYIHSNVDACLFNDRVHCFMFL